MNDVQVNLSPLNCKLSYKDQLMKITKYGNSLDKTVHSSLDSIRCKVQSVSTTAESGDHVMSLATSNIVHGCSLSRSTTFAS